MGSSPGFITSLLHALLLIKPLKEMELVLDPAALQPLSLEGRIRDTVVLRCRELAEVTLELTFLTTVLIDSGTGETKYLTFLLTLRWALSLPLRQEGTGKIAVSQEHTWGKEKHRK